MLRLTVSQAEMDTSGAHVDTLAGGTQPDTIR
jgi:hypothetical protein